MIFMGHLHPKLISQQIMKRNINSLIIQANSQNNVPKDLWIIDKSTQKLDPLNSNDSTVNNLRLNRGVWFRENWSNYPILPVETPGGHYLEWPVVDWGTETGSVGAPAECCGCCGGPATRCSCLTCQCWVSARLWCGCCDPHSKHGPAGPLASPSYKIIHKQMDNWQNQHFFCIRERAN